MTTATTTTALRPFFRLVTRGAVFWLGGIALLCGGVLVAAVASPRAEIHGVLDPTFLATLYFPGVAGWLAGLAVQELQHTTFAWPLPSVGRRIAVGHVVAGAVTALVVTAAVASESAAPPTPALTFALGLGAYLAAGVLRDPRSRGRTAVHTGIVLVVFGASRDLARAADAYPWVAGAVALATGAAATARLFARSTFRMRPFRIAKPLPGRFSLEREREYARSLRLERGARARRWRGGYLDAKPWAWVRAAFHETHGALGWRDALRATGPLLGFGVLVLTHAWADRGPLPLGEAIGKALYATLFHVPGQPPLGGRAAPYPVVAIAIATGGVVLALFKAVGLGEALLYPLSRRDRARVAFRAGLVDVALLVLVAGVAVWAIGTVTGLAVGYGVRLDFVPFHLRALLVTLVLLPLGHRGRLRLRAATRRRDENTVPALFLGIVAFVVVVTAATVVLTEMAIAPGLETAALVVAVVASQVAYRRMLATYYRTADLA